MKSRLDGITYNDRLFASGLRSSLHRARFHWITSKIKQLNCAQDSVLELGCFDGKLLQFLSTEPRRYVGIDANWEGGLDLAKQKWKSHPHFSFREASTPDGMLLDEDECFDMAVAMETFEHIPPSLVDGYLKKIAKHLDGYLFLTVPNEKGVVFLAKWMAKRILSRDTQRYAFYEIINATVGRSEYVAREDHKGFDYSVLLKEVEHYFDIIDVTGHPLDFLPPSLCFGIGIVAKSLLKK